MAGALYSVGELVRVLQRRVNGWVSHWGRGGVVSKSSLSETACLVVTTVGGRFLSLQVEECADVLLGFETTKTVVDMIAVLVNVR